MFLEALWNRVSSGGHYGLIYSMIVCFLSLLSTSSSICWDASGSFISLTASHLFFQASNSHPWRRQWHLTPVLLPAKSHGRRSLVGCSPWGCKESDTTEQLHFHFSLSCIRKGNGNPFQCSCLENPRGGGAWWAAVYGVAQSRTRLK